MKKLSLPKSLNPLVILISLLTLILGFFGGIGYTKYSSNTNKYPTQATVKEVVDGDTLKLDSGQEFRLYGMNCPEKGQPYYQDAKDFTHTQASGKKVTIEYEPKYMKDKFGRLLGYVLLPDNLNISLVRQGLCKTVIYEKRAKLIYQDQLLVAENKAKQEKLNLWSK